MPSKIIALCFYVMLMLPMGELHAIEKPEEVLRGFYKLVSDGSCDAVVRIRSDYNEKVCRGNRDMQITSIAQILKENGLVTMEVKYKITGEEVEKKEFVQMELVGDGWQYRHAQSQTTIPLDVAPKAKPIPIAKRTVIESGRFGSRAILEQCWNTQELQGISDERRLRKLDPPDISRLPDEVLQSKEYVLQPLRQELRESIRYVVPNGDKKLVALTFDLCEQADEITGYEQNIVNYLRGNGIKATFFAGGKWMRSHPERTMQLMADPLFEIGNHAWTHGNLRVLKGAQLKEQILWTQAQYHQLRNELMTKACFTEKRVSTVELSHIPKLPATFRFPYGTCSREALDTLAGYGLSAIQWNVVTSDPWHKQTAQGIASTVLEKIKPGSIIIAHANGRGVKTAESLDLFIPKLIEQGYQFVTVSELLESGDIISANSCYELKPNDNLHYDRLFGDGTGIKRARVASDKIQGISESQDKSNAPPQIIRGGTSPSEITRMSPSKGP